MSFRGVVRTQDGFTVKESNSSTQTRADSRIRLQCRANCP